jgi:aldehyde:ferredoxin oxidoreductase
MLSLCVACDLVSPEGGEVPIKAMNATFGIQLVPDDVPALGIRVLKAEREFSNRKAGFTNNDDRMPEFFYKEQLPPHKTAVMISDKAMDSTFDF